MEARRGGSYPKAILSVALLALCSWAVCVCLPHCGSQQHVVALAEPKQESRVELAPRLSIAELATTLDRESRSRPTLREVCRLAGFERTGLTEAWIMIPPAVSLQDWTPRAAKGYPVALAIDWPGEPKARGFVEVTLIESANEYEIQQHLKALAEGRLPENDYHVAEVRVLRYLPGPHGFFDRGIELVEPRQQQHD